MDKNNLAQLREAMMACEQTTGLSVLAHGEMVSERYKELLGFLRADHPLTTEWRLPDWISDPGILTRLLDDETMELYQTFHDCGKPSVLTIDEDGHRHFPDHAEASYRTWLDLGGSELVATLIREDMDAHLLKDAGVAEFSTRHNAIALLLTALCEIHANASMFGGIESVSFKMKWKQLDKRGRAILRQLAAA